MNPRLRRWVWVLAIGVGGCDAATSTPPKNTASQDAPPVVREQASGPVAKKVTLVRTPERGIQPQAVMDQGVLHLIYFKGDPGSGDVFYVQSKDNGQSFTKPLRVNSHAASVIAVGNVRGAHLAVGAGGRAHVAWMGSSKAEPKVGKESPMLYARLNDAGDAFEPQRNLIQAAVGLDGGGSIAAEGKNVFVTWHAPTPGSQGEDQRRVWLRTSNDEGRNFAKETPISPDGAGACGCCGMRIFGASGQTWVLFRGAQETVHRPIHLLTRDPLGEAFRSVKLHEWDTGVCPMSTMAFAAAPNATLTAWETEGQVYYTRLKQGVGEPAAPVAAPGKSSKRRHPALAANEREVLLAWTEGMGWNRGGGLAWQVFDAKDQAGVRGAVGDYGRADGVPVWSLITAVTLPEERFLIIY